MVNIGIRTVRAIILVPNNQVTQSQAQGTRMRIYRLRDFGVDMILQIVCSATTPREGEAASQPRPTEHESHRCA